MIPTPAHPSFDPPVETAQAPAPARGVSAGAAGSAGAAWASSSAVRGALAGALALLLHAGFFVAAAGLDPVTRAPHLHAERPPMPRAELVPLEGFAPPEVTPVPAMAAVPRVAPARAQAPSATPAPAAPAPAPAPMADFTNVAGAFHSATTYAVASSRAVVGAVTGAMHGHGAGGAGTAGGSGAGGAGGSGAGQAAPGTPSLAQPVRLVGDGGRCPWPGAAMAADLYQQRVTVRVSVGADGHVEGASATRDPGYGFGAAAEACARSGHFAAARDASGQPVRATTTIRYSFER